ncbi:MAG TPA: hypothetical protein DD490_08945, partial [Acidobacteria bacterium]|nr:hypothetical protein [Acidobacteriota bacterium]
EAAGRRSDARVLAGFAAELEAGPEPEARLRRAMDGDLAARMERLADRRFASYHRELEVVVDRERARFSTWYEMSARATGATWKEAEALLPAVSAMGFDVLALPPLPLSGRAASGSAEEVRLVLDKARELGLEIALELAWPVAPDPDPESWRELWQDLKSAVDLWVARGVRIFRASDPETRTFPFWEWLLTAVKREHPDVLFWAGGETRPKLSARLAKLGFTWNAADVPWQGSKAELTARCTELTAS